MAIDMRRLGCDDVRAMRDLLAMYADAFEDRIAYASNPPSDAYLGAFLEDSRNVVLASFDEAGAIVGALVAYAFDKFEQERRELYIYDLAVAQTHRRRGIARHLISELRDIARNLGAHVIFVQTGRDDLPAITLYESFGDSEEVYHFDFDVNAGAGKN